MKLKFRVDAKGVPIRAELWSDGVLWCTTESMLDAAKLRLAMEALKCKKGL